MLLKLLRFASVLLFSSCHFNGFPSPALAPGAVPAMICVHVRVLNVCVLDYARQWSTRQNVVLNLAMQVCVCLCLCCVCVVCRVHNPGKLDDRDQVMELVQAFEGRETELNGALMKQYQQDLTTFTASVSPTAAVAPSGGRPLVLGRVQGHVRQSRVRCYRDSLHEALSRSPSHCRRFGQLLGMSDHLTFTLVCRHCSRTPKVALCNAVCGDDRRGAPG